MRATATASITIGLVSVPVKIYTAIESKAIKFNMITPNGNRACQKYFDAGTGDEVTHGDCNKGYEYAKGQFVVFTAEEMKRLDTVGTKAIEIREFVDADTFDPILVEKTYLLGPDKGGDKAYTLFARAMRQEGKIAVAQWAARGREHLVVVRPHKNGLVMHQLYYKDEVRDLDTAIEVAEFQFHPAEEDMAAKLINSLSTGTIDVTKYEDGYARRVREAVEAKIDGRDVVLPVESQAPTVVDLFEALKMSVEQEQQKKAAAAPKKGRKKAKEESKTL